MFKGTHQGCGRVELSGGPRFVLLWVLSKREGALRPLFSPFVSVGIPVSTALVREVISGNGIMNTPPCASRASMALVLGVHTC